uniref:VP2 n=1 Tax=Shelduck calicivirus TaxID=2212776 RepID=A0A3G1RPG6_9CALI|nr:MAG: VP2 [Shelduck calicivirus]
MAALALAGVGAGTNLVGTIGTIATNAAAIGVGQSIANTQIAANTYYNELAAATQAALPMLETQANLAFQTNLPQIRAAQADALGLGGADRAAYITYGHAANHGGVNHFVNFGNQNAVSGPVNPGASFHSFNFTYAPPHPSFTQPTHENQVGAGSRLPSQAGSPSVPSSTYPSLHWSHGTGGTPSTPTHSSWPSTGSTGVSSQSHSRPPLPQSWTSSGTISSGTSSSVRPPSTGSWGTVSSVGSIGSWGSTSLPSGTPELPSWATVQSPIPIRNPSLGLGLNQPFK